MSPTRPGSYQSHFLRSMLSRTRRWLERSQRAARQVQMAASWSAQILLYPVYALFQATRLLGKRLGTMPPTTSARLDEAAGIEEICLSSGAMTLSADTAIQQVLQTVQSLAIAADIPIQLNPVDSRICGIATQLDTKALVLVTARNEILDVLTAEQQDQLQERILWEVADYGRELHRWEQLPQCILGGFLHSARSLLARLQPGRPAIPLLPAAPAVDLSIRRSLLTVRQFLYTADHSPVSPTLSTSSALHSLPTTRLSAHVVALVPLSSLPATTLHIRGVASLLDTRSLVLVTNQNGIYDILTAEQQQLIRQRISWAVAHYQRYLKLRQQVAGLAPFRPTRDNSRVLPPVQAFQRLMAWMQTGAVAIATNLFQEADLLEPALVQEAARLPAASPHPGRSSFQVLPSDSLRQGIQWLRQLAATFGGLPVHLPGLSDHPPQRSVSKRVSSPLAPGAIAQSNVTSASRRSPGSGLTLTGRSANAISGLSSMGLEAGSLPSFSSRQTADLEMGRSREVFASASSTFIETEVTLMGYEFSLLERVLHWLDRGLLWIETLIARLWNGLRGIRH